jgi:hypothetical protein
MSWHPIQKRPSAIYPDTQWTPAVELRIQHERFDLVSRHPASPGVFLNRHVAPDRGVPSTKINRDHPGYDQDVMGGDLSAASAPGGALYDENDGKTRFQREWDYLFFHAQRAIDRRHLSRQALPNHEDYMRGEDKILPWHMAEAIAAYAVQFKTRMPKLGITSHPIDTLLSSYHCAGAANICFALATVLGIPARRVSTSGHSTCELLIEGRWCWVDNIRAGVHLVPMSYQEYLAGLKDSPCTSAGQKAHHSQGEVFYRSAYDYSPNLAWRFGGEHAMIEGTEGDVESGIGLGIHYDPSTASGLYPGYSEYRFHADDCELPTLTIGYKNAWLHAPAGLEGDLVLRRRLYVDDTPDNPITAAELCTWCPADLNPEAIEVKLNGTLLETGHLRAHRGCHTALISAVPAEQLQAGWNEILLQAKPGKKAEIMLYPDVMTSYESPASQKVELDSRRIKTDPVVQPVPKSMPVGS